MSVDEIRAAYYASLIQSEPDKQNDLRQQLIALLIVQSDNLRREYNISNHPGESIKKIYRNLQIELTNRHKKEQEELSRRRVEANNAKKSIDTMKAEIAMLTRVNSTNS
jgi:hypothetical protein